MIERPWIGGTFFGKKASPDPNLSPSKNLQKGDRSSFGTASFLKLTSGFGCFLCEGNRRKDLLIMRDHSVRVSSQNKNQRAVVALSLPRRGRETTEWWMRRETLAYTFRRLPLSKIHPENRRKLQEGSVPLFRNAPFLKALRR